MGSSLPPSIFMVFLPWVVAVAMLLIGGTTIAVAGLPWLTKAEAELHRKNAEEEAKLHRQNYDDRITAIMSIVATTVENVSKVTDQVGKLVTAVAVVQAQIEERVTGRRTKKAA